MMKVNDDDETDLDEIWMMGEMVYIDLWNVFNGLE